MMSQHVFRTLVVAWTLVTLATAARAQSAGDSAAAQGLFDQGKALMAAGKAAEACPKFEESQRLDPGSGTLLNLASCYEHVGRLASAWSKYLEAAVAARGAGNPEREGKARELAATLAPRVSKLVIEVPEGSRVEGLQVTRDGGPVGAPQWGLAIPADEGEHAIVATAPGFRAFRGVAAVKGEGTTATLSIPRLAPEPRAAGRDDTPQEAHRSSGLGRQKMFALVAGGVGVVGLGLGTVFALQSKSKHDEAAKWCDGGDCTDQRGVDAGNAARSAGNAATVGMIVGAAGLAGGLVLWFTAPGSETSARVGLGPGRVDVRGVF